jgi:hypothetical protein
MTHATRYTYDEAKALWAERKSGAVAVNLAD